MTGLVIACSALLGLLVGSFLNVVVWRVPRGESVVSPPSACPACGHRIRSRDNVPVLSWLALRGRCRDCGAPIARRYPLVEAGTALLFALTGWFVSETLTLWALPAMLYLAAVMVALTLIDLDVHRLPDAIVLPSYGVGAGLLLLADLAPDGSLDTGAAVRAVIGAAALAAFFFVLFAVNPRGMGFGDVKLAGVLGLYLGWFGWGALAVGAFGAFVLGGVFGIGLLVTRRAGRKSGIPFGPWMIAGAILGIAAGEPLWASYLAVF
ncbi:prepilin peptidase [Cellulomonas sp. NPDC058312]|uniref:prepilin peptidase n=1 Tax=Cellulomonas sp. NPDC058312 TaxID=3346441 RepID=UPI0036E51D09